MSTMMMKNPQETSEQDDHKCNICNPCYHKQRQPYEENYEYFDQNNSVLYVQAFPMEVMSVTTFKNERTDNKSYKHTFTGKYMVGVNTPHNDAPVLSVHISMFEVRKILIDPGSSSEIMYHRLFKKLHLSPSRVKRPICQYLV